MVAVVVAADQAVPALADIAIHVTNATLVRFAVVAVVEVTETVGITHHAQIHAVRVAFARY